VRLGELDVERVDVVAGDGVAIRSVVVQRAEHRDRCAGVVQALQVDGRGMTVGSSITAVTRTVVAVPAAMLVGVSCTVPMLGAAQAADGASSRPAK
jgi:hypothetical protein